jgi:hypothetical protein
MWDTGSGDTDKDGNFVVSERDMDGDDDEFEAESSESESDKIEYVGSTARMTRQTEQLSTFRANDKLVEICETVLVNDMRSDNIEAQPTTLPEVELQPLRSPQPGVHHISTRLCSLMTPRLMLQRPSPCAWTAVAHPRQYCHLILRRTWIPRV